MYGFLEVIALGALVAGMAVAGAWYQMGWSDRTKQLEAIDRKSAEREDTTRTSMGFLGQTRVTRITGFEHPSDTPRGF